MPPTELRILYNQDCTNLFGITKEPITPSHVDHMVDEVADGGAHVMLINPNAQRTNYPSHAWQTFWDGHEPGGKDFFGPVPEDDLPHREHWVNQMQRLAEGGCNYLQRALTRCRTKGITPGISVRMNDMHDVPWPGSHLFNRFYIDHPELRLDNPPAVCGWSAQGLNYEYPEVREHYLALIRELATGYDFDVLELDFLRFSSYFPRCDFERHAATMTHFIRAVREVLRATGRTIELIPRVATSPAAAYELGFDVSAWACEGLIDGLTAAAFLNTNWDIPIDEFRSLVGDAMPLYAGSDMTIERVNGLPSRYLPLHAEHLRGFAAAYHAAGADGLNFFNFFCTREKEGWGSEDDPLFSLLRELRAPEELRGRPKAYAVTGASDGGMQETDRPSLLPASLPGGRRRDFRVLMAAEPDQVEVTVDVTLTGKPLPEPAQLWLHINTHAAGPATALTATSDVGTPSATARFTTPAQALREGWNRLMLRNEGPDTTILRIDVRATAHA